MEKECTGTCSAKVSKFKGLFAAFLVLFLVAAGFSWKTYTEKQEIQTKLDSTVVVNQELKAEIDSIAVASVQFQQASDEYQTLVQSFVEQLNEFKQKNTDSLHISISAQRLKIPIDKKGEDIDKE